MGLAIGLRFQITKNELLDEVRGSFKQPPSEGQKKSQCNFTRSMLCRLFIGMSEILV